MKGYVFNFNGQAFDPNGKVESMSQADIDAHNRELAKMEWQEMIDSGRGWLYLSRKDIPADPTGKALERQALVVSTWEGSHFARVNYSRKSFHNMAGRDRRTDVWFTLAGSRWHGVNIGDNQVCRVKRCKK